MSKQAAGKKPVEVVHEVVKEEPPKEEEQIATTKIETEGFGRFEYPNGIIYEGQWKLENK